MTILYRCDGRFKLVVEQQIPGNNRTIYLVGISGDNIAYVTQASNSFTIVTEGGAVLGEISPDNFRHTENVLYIDVSEYRKFMEKLHILPQQCERQVTVHFNLKSHYFQNLKNFVNSLDDEIISRIIPSKLSQFKLKDLDNDCKEALNLTRCSKDQCMALTKIISCQNDAPPILVTGPFGTGKTRILALAAHYYLQNISSTTSILVCTQQHTSANAFLEHFCERCSVATSDKVYIARVIKEVNNRRDKLLRGYRDFEEDFKRKPPTKQRPYLIVTTCHGAHQLKKRIPNFCFTHIFIDEVCHMREAEAVAPLCFANKSTKIVLAGDKQQVSPIVYKRENGGRIGMSYNEKNKKMLS